jgi:hypothetical protein
MLTGSLGRCLGRRSMRLWREGGFAGATSGVPDSGGFAGAVAAVWRLAGLAWARLVPVAPGGLTVAVDPALPARILGAGQRFTPSGLPRPPPLDLVLISHNTTTISTHSCSRANRRGNRANVSAPHGQRRDRADLCALAVGESRPLCTPGLLTTARTSAQRSLPFFEW